MVDSAHFQPDDRPVDDQLADLRVRIDAVDQQLIALINQRARLAQAVGEVKKLDGSPVFRPDREAQVIDRVKAQNPGPVREDSLAPIWREIMSACRALEAQQRVAFLGPIGTFSEQATLNYFGSSIDALACPSVDEVFRATISGSADYGVVPVENSTEGVVARSLDLLLASPLTIVGETSLLVTHNLLRKEPSREGITVVCAHPQALAQCHNWLSQNLPDAERRPVSSNAEGARLAAQAPSIAALASERAASQYGLHVVQAAVQDEAGVVDVLRLFGEQLRDRIRIPGCERFFELVRRLDDQRLKRGGIRLRGSCERKSAEQTRRDSGEEPHSNGSHENLALEVRHRSGHQTIEHRMGFHRLRLQSCERVTCWTPTRINAG